MKLRLPHKFQAALMAALASVSFTTLSTGSTAYAAAVQLTDMSSWDGYDTETGYALVGTQDGVTTKGTQGNGQQWSKNSAQWSFVITFDPTALQAGQTYNLAALNIVQSKGTGYIEGAWLVMGENNQATFHFGAWDRGDVSSTVDLSGVDDVTVVFSRGNGTKSYFYAYKDDSFSSAAVTLESSQVLSFSDTTVDTHIGALDGVTYFNNGTNKVRMPADTTVGSYDVYGAGYTNNSLPATADLETYHNSITVLQWNGSETSNNWNSTDANWLKWGKGEAMAFTVEGAQALFGKGDELNKTVNVTGDSAVSVGGVRVMDNYTFNMAGNLNAGTITIAQGASLARTGNGSLTGTLAGAGTFILPNGSTTLGVTLGSDWTGTVQLTGVTLANQNLNTYGIAGSTVEINGTTGYIVMSNTTFNPMIKLSGAGLTITQGSSGKQYTFQGGMSGTGAFNVKFNKQTYIFTGDVSQWTGAMNVTVNDTNVKFYGSANTVNAAFTRTAGALNMEVGDGTNAFSTTFNRAVTATKLAVNNKASATLKETLTLTGDLTLDGSATLEKGGSVGTIDLSHSGNAHGTLTLAAGQNLTYSSSFWGANNNKLLLGAGATVKQANNAPIEIVGLAGESYVSSSANAQFGLTASAYTLHNVQATIKTASDNVQLRFDNSKLVTSQNITLKNLQSVFSGMDIQGGTTTVGASDLAEDTTAQLGTVTLSGGNLTLADHVIGSASNINVTGSGTISGGMLSVGGTITTQTDNGLTFVGSGTLTLGKDSSATAAISGTGALTFNGPAVTLYGDNSTFTGDLTISGGTVTVANDLALGSMVAGTRTVKLAGGTLDVNGHEGTGTGYTVEFAGGKLTNTGTSHGSGHRQLVAFATITADSEISNATDHEMGFGTAGFAPITVTFANDAKLNKTGTGTFWVSNATVSGEGGFKVSEGTLHFQQGGTYAATDLEMAGGTVAGTLNLAGNITIDTTKDSTLSAAITGNNRTITMEGTGALTLSGGSSFTGSVLVKEGTVKLGNGNALGAENNTVTIEQGATVDMNGKDNRMYSYTLNGGSLVNNGADTVFNHTQNNRITLTADSTVGGSGKLWMIAGGWGDTTANLNDRTLTKVGTGTFSFVNTDISAGTIMVNQGTVEFYDRGGNGSNNSNVQAHITLNGGTISGAYNYTASDSAVTRNLTVNQSATTSAAITIGNNVTLATSVAENQVLTLGGAITGTGNFSLSGPGTLKLAGSDMISANTLTFNSGSTLDVSNIAQMAGITVNLASYTVSASYSNLNITGLNSGLTYSLTDDGSHVAITFASQQVTPPTPTSPNLGNVMYVGDSITDGEAGQKSWRYSFFQVLADGGIGQTEEGYFQHTQTSRAITTTTYGGRTFENNHSAHTSARSTQTAGLREGRYDNTNIKNWLGISTEKTDGTTYPEGKPVYKDETAPNTYFMLLGTNDLLSEGGNHVTEQHFNGVLNTMFGYSEGKFDGESGTFDIIWGAMTEARAESKLIVMEMPTWSPNHGNHQNAADFAYMTKFNQKLHEWATSKDSSNITIVNPNPGIVDVANTTKPGAGVATMFADGLHPSAQGELLIAGNIAKQLGYAGRTVGLDRASHSNPGTTEWHAEESSIAVTSTAQTFAENAFSTADGYTIDFGALYGDGFSGGWSDKANALSVQVGDGYHTGILTFSEAYVMWGGTVLYSRDNSQEGDNFRIAYVNASADPEDNVSAGYYVWMGDMLIGEALTAASGDFNGIQLTSTGADGTVTNLTWSDTAYAPTTTLYKNPDSEALFHLTQVNPYPTHDNDEHSSLNIDFSKAPVVSGQYATNNQPAEGPLVVKQTNIGNSWFGPAGANHTGNIAAEYTGVTSGGNLFGAVVSSGSITVTGDVSAVVDGGASLAKGSYDSSGEYSVFGSYQGTITGKFSLEINDATLSGGVMMGVVKGNNSIASTDLHINSGAVINGDIFGGNHSANGTITGNSDITITGGTVNGSVYGGNMDRGTIGGNTSITITGGIISGDVTGGNKTGGTINGSTNVTIEGGLPSIGGNISAQNVTLKDVAANGHGYEDGFDTYAGSINATNKLTLDNYTVGEMLATLNATRLEATHGTVTTINNMGPGAVAITVDEDSSLTLGNVKLSTAITNDGSITFAGNVILDDMTATHTDESYVDGKVEGNGFYSSKSSVAVFTVEHVGSVVTDAANMTYKGAAGTMNANGVFTTNEVAKDLTTFYIKSQAENLSTVTGVSADATVTMSDATKLVVDGTGTIFSTDKIVLAEGASGATLEIGNGNTATAGSANKSLTLTGSGIYRLNNASRDMKGAQLHSSDWTGSVEVSGSMGVRDCSFDGLANANSTVLMSGAYFWWNPNNVSAQNANIRLNDAFKDNGQSGTANGSALQISGTNAGANYVFNGAFTGEGDFAYVNANTGDARNANFFLRGNLSGWTGDFVNYNGTTGTHPTLHLDGAGAVVLGGGIVQKSTGALNVNLGGNNSTSVTVNGDVAVEEGGTLNLTANKETTFNGSVEASNLTVSAGTTVTTNASLDVSGTTAVNQGGTLNIMNIAGEVSLSVGDVTIGAGATMGVYADADAVTEATLEIASGKTLTAAGEGATLNGNLELAAGSHLDVRNTDNDVAGLIMGSTVTLNKGVILDDYDATTWAGWADGTKYALFTGVDGLDLGSGTGTAAIDYTQWVDAKEYFTNIDEANRYFLCYDGAPAENQNGVLQATFDGSNVGMVYVMVMPEPTTSTLSLLALCALAARRRRK